MNSSYSLGWISSMPIFLIYLLFNHIASIKLSP